MLKVCPTQGRVFKCVLEASLYQGLASGHSGYVLSLWLCFKTNRIFSSSVFLPSVPGLSTDLCVCVCMCVCGCVERGCEGFNHECVCGFMCIYVDILCMCVCVCACIY